ncbi:MAG: multiheme c-type cytochrome [bacterium]|nr:multiheme c-type cytochrome [bacterium]
MIMKRYIICFILIFFFSVPCFAQTSDSTQTTRNELKINKAEYEDVITLFKKMKVEKFVKPDVCGGCHAEIYKQWQGSMHSKAFIDPVWRAATKLFNGEAKTLGQILEMKTCVKCHTPLGFRSKLIQSPADNYDELEDIPAQGIFCNWCHNINEAIQIGDAGYEVKSGEGEEYASTMIGPREDARWNDSTKLKQSDFHPSEYSKFYTKSEFCGLCHNVSHIENKLPIEQTYNEWKDGPYNNGDDTTTVHCQDCHMRQKSGIPSTGNTDKPDNPGRAADQGPDRGHVWTHYFAGGNSIVPKLLGSDIHSYLAIDRLTHSASLEIIPDDSYVKGAVSKIKIKVTNSGAGHYLPTGVTAIRQMWLDIKITDKNGAEIYRSGGMDTEGNLEKNTVLFNTILGDKDGNPVINVALADRILYDHRILPKGYMVENYSFIIPENAVSPLQIETVLKYRSVAPSLLKTLLGGKTLGEPVPVIDMAILSKKIDFE